MCVPNLIPGFGGSDRPDPQPQPEPTRQDPNVAAAAEAERIRRAGARGRAATVLTSRDQFGDAPSLRKTVLGA